MVEHSDMRVLLVSSLYPPYVIGGAEMSAYNLAEWLSGQGISVGVVTAADEGADESSEITTTGVRIWRLNTPYIYAPFRFPQAPSWQKPLWHIQDHLDGRLSKRFGEILDEFRPSLVNMHLLQGMGYQLLKEVASRELPVAFVLHDLGLACIRMSMFKDGHDCVGQCKSCFVSSLYKAKLLSAQKKAGLISPSWANLRTLGKYFPTDLYPRTAIPNPNKYPAATLKFEAAKTLRLLYAGRLHESKGVDRLLVAVERLASKYDISLTLAGAGFQELELRERFGHYEWCSFLGFVDQEKLSNLMVQHDLLCIPSIWAENSPGVVIQALSVGLPVVGTARGGIPELVEDGINGALVEGVEADDWVKTLERLVNDRAAIEEWRPRAELSGKQYEQDQLGQRVLNWMRALSDTSPSASLPPQELIF